MWAVWNPSIGIYADLRFSRRDMITAHCGSAAQTWEKCVNNGDRCIPVLVTPILPKPRKKVKP